MPRQSRFAQRDNGDEGGYSSQAYVGYSIGSKSQKSSPLRTILPIAVAVVVLCALIFGGYTLANSLGLIGGEAGSSSGEQVEVFIPEGSTTSEIASILKDADVIAKESSFIAAVQKRAVENALLPGKYSLTTGMSDNEVIDALLSGANPVVLGNKLTIPEGLTLEATAERVEAACGIPAADFIAEARSADKYVEDYPFLQGVYNNSMEGFLYPKTYDIPVGSSASYVIRVLLDQFAIETADLDMSYAQERNLTLFDIVTIASMVENETAAPEERPLVSSVIYNRLHEGMPLQICATVIYAFGWDNYDGHPLLESDLLIDSPYNTYQVSELPAGPICSPRLESIEAAAHPNETNYLYYVLTSKEGTHTFCETWEQFEEANARYHELFEVPN
ncbi:MAG: endolytic transglycosylase MltG [Coriobacteriales bacterium]|jgi:UPF0755 protein|nr:endolytic transglycosylase MltG [Coriobacteriales bacterium]